MMIIDFFEKYRALKYVSLSLLIIASFILTFSTALHLRDVVIYVSDGNVIHSEIPIHSESSGLKEYLITGSIDYNFLSQNIVNIIPDDCLLSIKVNGNDVPLTGVNPSLLENYVKGFHFNLGKYLKSGSNHVEFKIRDSFGAYGLNIISSYKDIKFIIYLFILIFLIFITFVFIMFDLKWEKKYIVLLSGGLIIRLIYLMVTNFSNRSLDAYDHIAYIEYIVNNMALPKASEGFVFYHPPFYYLIGAIIFKLIRLLGIINRNVIYICIQFYSLVSYMIFLAVSIRIFNILMQRIKRADANQKSLLGLTSHLSSFRRLKEIFNYENITMWVSSLFVFWPTNILHSVRVGNDGLMYLFYALGLLYLLKWEDSNLWKDLILASIYTSLGIITKTNTVVLMGLIGFMMLLRFIKTQNKKAFILNGITVSGIFLIALLIAFGPSLMERLKGKNANLLVANAGNLNPALYVGNTAANYIWFDTKIFVTEPFCDAWNDAWGRQYFWNFLLKTSLYSQFLFNHPVLRNIGTIIGFLFLFMFAYSIFGLLFMTLRRLKLLIIIVTNFILLIFAALIFRIMIPAACSNDFRYIQPALISMCFFFGFSLLEYRTRGWNKMVYSGYGLAFLFIMLNVIFFIGLGLGLE